MCSHMPDTTRPIAKPATPVVTAPRNAARRKNPRTMPSIGRSQDEVTSAWMDGCHLKGRLLCPPRSERVSAHGCRAVAEIVEQRHAVRLGPYADRTRACDVVVVRLDVLPAVQAHAHLLPGEVHAQRMPRVARYRRIDVLDRVAPAVDRVVERHIVLERVGARDVVVVAVLPAPYHPARLVFTAGERLELDLNVTVLKRHLRPHTPWEESAARLLEDVGLARRGSVGLDRPFGEAATGDAGAPAGRQRAGRVTVEGKSLGV